MTISQKTKIGNAFPDKMSAGKAQVSKTMQSTGFLGSFWASPVMKMMVQRKYILWQLGFTAAAFATDVALH